MAENPPVAQAQDAAIVVVNNLSVTQAFDSDQALRELLIRLRFPLNSINRLITQEGLSSARELSRTRPKNLADSLESVNKLFGASNRAGSRIYFSNGRINQIKALAAYFRRCLTANRIPDVRLIGPIQVSSFEDYLEDWSKKSDNIQDSISNNLFKFDPTNFVKFWQMIETMCSAIRGSRGISLEYLLRTDDANSPAPVEEAVPDVNSLDFMRLNASLKGNDYETDNRNLYTILRHYLSNTPGWNVISRFSTESNGRKAFKTLRAHYEGASYFDLIKTKANSMMMKTFYRGDTLKFSWEKFVAVHLEAHRMFDDIGEPLTDSLKILYMKGGIRPESGLESSLEVAKGLPNVNSKFDLFVNHVTESVTNRRSRAEMLRIAQPRHVSGSFARGRGFRAPFRGGRSGGRFHRGGRAGRSFRGRGRGPRGNYNYGGGAPNSSIPETISVEGKTLYPRKVYHKSEYDQLSFAQKDELSKARRSVSGLYSDGNSTIDSRNIKSAISEGIRDYMNEKDTAGNGNSVANQISQDDSSSFSLSDQFKRRRPNPN